MANETWALPDSADRRSLGRVLLDAVSKTILTVVFFFLRFVAWGLQWSVAAVCMLLVMGAAGYYVFYETLSGGRYVSVPNVVGLPNFEAQERITNSELEMRQTYQPHASVPENHVIAQRPTAGRVVRQGRGVEAIISSGAGMTAVADFTRRSLGQAQTAIESEEYQLGSVARIPHRTPRDTVIAQDPAPGREIANRGMINLLVSAGQGVDRLFMPDLRGMPMAQAEALAQQYGLTPQANFVEIPGAEDGVVLDQSPAADALVYPGQPVRYDVKMPSYVARFRHEFPYDWYDKDVRIDIFDRNGTLVREVPYPAAFDSDSRQARRARSAVTGEIEYNVSSTVRVFVNESLVETYFFEEGRAPITQSG